LALPPTAPFSNDEESSGVIEIFDLLRKRSEGKHSEDWDFISSRRGGDDDDGGFDDRLKWVKRNYRYYLGDTQAHYSPNDAELVEGGQLFLVGVPKSGRWH
jgi:hypothetical protein